MKPDIHECIINMKIPFHIQRTFRPTTIDFFAQTFSFYFFTLAFKIEFKNKFYPITGHNTRLIGIEIVYIASSHPDVGNFSGAFGDDK